MMTLNNTALLGEMYCDALTVTVGIFIAETSTSNLQFANLPFNIEY